MKIAIVINTSWNIYNFRRGLIDNLLQNNHTIHTIAPEDAYTPYLVNLGCKYHPIKLDNTGRNPFKDLIYTAALFKIYKKIKPDVILHYTIKPNIYGTFAAKMLGIPVINNVSGLGAALIHKNLTARIAKQLYKIAFGFPNKVFFQNETDLALFVKHKLIKKQIAETLPGSGVSIEKFFPAPFKRNKTFTFLVVARLLYEKGIVEYIDAIKILKKKGIQARYQILGFLTPENTEGIPTKQLDKWVTEGFVEYLGATDDVKAVMDEADCIVLPSYREGTSRALLEAASLAKPLIATNVPGCVETIDEGENGFLCEVKNPEDLADKMLKMLLLNEDELKSMGIKSREKVEKKFDEKIVIKKYIDAIEILTHTRISSDTPEISVLNPCPTT